MIRVPDDLHATLKATAVKRGTTVTALLLDPWREGDSHPQITAATPVPLLPLIIPPPTSWARRKPNAPPKKPAKAKATPKPAPHGRKVGVDALTGKAIYR